MALAFEQREKESDKAFAAFSVYLSQGPERSLAKAAAKLGRSKVLLERWSRKFDWPARVAVGGLYEHCAQNRAAGVAIRLYRTGDRRGVRHGWRNAGRSGRCWRPRGWALPMCFWRPWRRGKEVLVSGQPSPTRTPDSPCNVSAVTSDLLTWLPCRLRWQGW